eukprot:Skav217433  [mRNA]  locus=scaffold1729:261303:262415:+ [translate_table: standard]
MPGAVQWWHSQRLPHTSRAVPALLGQFKPLGYRLALSEPVPDRFDVSDEAGSYRGLSRGVAVASKFPLFSPRPSSVPSVAWASQRLLYSVLQIGQVPLHLVVVYLHPNPTPGSFRHQLNCQLLEWASNIVQDLEAPACILGDFNSPWTDYDSMESLHLKGWADLHLLCSQMLGVDPQPTCKQATRHTFVLANPGLRSFVRSVWVDFEDDLDSHSVLLAKFSVPSYNPLVWKWLLPKSFDNCCFDPLLPQQEPDTQWKTDFQACLNGQDMSKAFALWSKGAEHTLLQAARLDDQPLHPKGFTGRGQALQPVRRALAAPRFKAGRPTDFAVEPNANSLVVRQVQKQARRLQNLGRLLRKAPHQPPSPKAVEL